MLKNCLIFGTGMIVGGYYMYNKIYKQIATIVINNANKKSDNKSETEKTDN